MVGYSVTGKMGAIRKAVERLAEVPEGSLQLIHEGQPIDEETLACTPAYSTATCLHAVVRLPRPREDVAVATPVSSPVSV
jgi:hypothetical protein